VVTFADGRRARVGPRGSTFDGDLAVVAVDTADAPRSSGARRCPAWATPSSVWPTPVGVGCG